MQKILHFDSLDQNILHSTALIKYFAFHLSRCKISLISSATVGLDFHDPSLGLAHECGDCGGDCSHN
jgi:hypothetical protein